MRGEELKKLRKSLGYKQGVFGLMIGISGCHVSSLEKGNRNIHNHIIIKINEVFKTKYEIQKKVCKCCGEDFIPKTDKKVTCYECDPYDNMKIEINKPKRKPKETLAEFNAKAKELGLSYGKYEAFKNVNKKLKGVC